MVVGRRAEQRWRLSGALGLAPAAASAPDVAASRLAHPSTDVPDAVVLVVDGLHDLGWLHDVLRRGAHDGRGGRGGRGGPGRRRAGRAGRGSVPVVAVVTRPQLAGAARAAGARAVVELGTSATTLASQLRAAVADVTAPAVVIDLDAVRSA